MNLFLSIIILNLLMLVCSCVELYKYSSGFDKLYEFTESPRYLIHSFKKTNLISKKNILFSECELYCESNSDCITFEFLQISLSFQICSLYKEIPLASHIETHEHNFKYQVIYVKKGIYKSPIFSESGGGQHAEVLLDSLDPVEALSFSVYYDDSFPRNILFYLSNRTILSLNTQTAPNKEKIDLKKNYIYQINFRQGTYTDAIQFCLEDYQTKVRSCTAYCGNPYGGGPGSFSIEQYNGDIKKFNFMGVYGGFGDSTDFLGIFFG